jgi:chromosome segregation protein
MYLSEIEIIGFKSFAQKTKLKFGTGLSAIVGPNGCGKTNIVDAIRWVLGEKKASILRSDVMENVIFNGSKDRKPVGMAEVTLTMDNNKGVLPTEYSQVNVSRTLFRSGESKYKINNQVCRLKDILDLFMDTGIGADSYSVIELKMVEAILSGRVDERRTMFEEAAGIKKFKQRKKETSRKLELVSQDLERVEDILQEVRKNVNSLSRQAGKTRRYNKLQSELKEIQLKYYKHDFHELSVEKSKIENQLAEENKKNIAIEFKLNESEKELNRLKNSISENNVKFRQLQQEEDFLQKDIAGKNRVLAVSREKLANFDSVKSRLAREIDEAEYYIDKTQSAIGEHNKDLEQNDLELKKALEKIDRTAELKEESRAVLNNIRDEASRLAEEVSGYQSRINSFETFKKRAENKKRQTLERAEKTDLDIESAQRKITETEQEKSKISSEIEAAERNVETATERLELGFEQKKSLEGRHATVDEKMRDIRGEINSRKNSLDFLNSLTDTSGSSKYLASEKQWLPGSEKTNLAELVGIDDEYRLAALAALGDAGYYFVVDSKEDAHSGLEFLRKNKKGKSGFIIREMIPEAPAPDMPEPREGFFGFLSELARVDGDLRNSLRIILGRMAVVSSREKAVEAVESGLAQSAVTLQGEVISGSGIIRGGSISDSEGMIVGKRERIKNLRDDIANLNGKLESLDAEKSEISVQISSIDIRELESDKNTAERGLSDLRKKLASAGLTADSLANKLELYRENKARLEKEIAEIEGEFRNYDEEIEEIEQQLMMAKEEQTVRQGELDEARENFREYEENFREAEIEAVNIRNKVNSVKREIDRLSGGLQNTRNNLEQKKRELANAENEKEDLQGKIKENTEQIEILENELEQKSVNIQYLSDELDSLNARESSAGEELNNHRREHELIKEKIHRIDIDMNRADMRIRQIEERVLENFEADIKEIDIEIDEEFSVEEAKQQIDELREKLNSLGSINFSALDQYDEEKDRLDFYEQQMADLTESEKTLRDTIDEINETAEKNFRETFGKIRENFQQLFKKLFGPDGEADVLLAEGDVLESDIIINAKPPNKRPHSIEMLSGGEKTLTAIALLFAIYLVKPSPFCILDEVDAPLDDQNIGKYINLIRDFSENTQFLIVTHNKKTMEAADTLYGVTMQEQGVSKVVTVRMEDEAA